LIGPTNWIIDLAILSVLQTWIAKQNYHI